MDSLPNFLTHGAPLRARESSAIKDSVNGQPLRKKVFSFKLRSLNAPRKKKVNSFGFHVFLNYFLKNSNL